MDRNAMFRSASPSRGLVLSSGARIRLLMPILTHTASVCMALVAGLLKQYPPYADCDVADIHSCIIRRQPLGRL